MRRFIVWLLSQSVSGKLKQVVRVSEKALGIPPQYSWDSADYLISLNNGDQSLGRNNRLIKSSDIPVADTYNLQSLTIYLNWT